MQQDYPSSPQQTSNLAVISLIAGILGITILPFLGSIVAVFTGHMARKEIAASNGTLSGDGLAIAGLILGYFVIVTSVLGICVVGAMLALGISLPLCLVPFANDIGALLSLLPLV